MKRSTASFMARETFVDTSGFYAVLVKADDRHTQAVALLDEAAANRRRFVTTDYVLDETTTLLTARGFSHLIDPFLTATLESQACEIAWTTEARFRRTADRVRKHLDHRWSFTDCLSFEVMNERRVERALTKDANFEEAGFVALLENERTVG